MAKFLSFLSNKIQLLSTIASSSGAGGADKIVATDSDGKIDRTFLSRVVALTDAATVTPNADTTDIGVLTSLSQATTFANPTGTPANAQLLQIRVTSAVSRAIAFGDQYGAASSLSIPLATTGGGVEDWIAFRRNSAISGWTLIATTIGASLPPSFTIDEVLEEVTSLIIAMG